MTNAMRLVSLSALTAPQIVAKSGLIAGAIYGTSSALKTKDHPSTEPSATSTVGPVIAAVHDVAPGPAW